MIQTLGALLLGAVLGAVVVLALRAWQRHRAGQVAAARNEWQIAQLDAQQAALFAQARDAFARLSMETLSQSTSEFLKLANSSIQSSQRLASSELAAQGEMLGQTLATLSGQMESMSVLVKDLERDRVQKFGELASSLRLVSEETLSLRETTARLNRALAPGQGRGQWGERMAEDVLRAFGFVESVNYVKQHTIAESGARPDFTFLLPQGRTLNMDVKFPLEAYQQGVRAEHPKGREQAQKQFLRDVRGRVREIASRAYIDPEQGTLDLVLMFVPNEAISAFLHESAPELIDEALRQRVVLCGPTSLFVILSVIREAMRHVDLTARAADLMRGLDGFKHHWEGYLEQVAGVSKRVSTLQKEVDALLTTQRRRVERPLQRLLAADDE